ncbi:MAG: hypothetical protein GY801_24245 [bacterium]|nr:hypothetical protein [bacterium]
MTIVALLIFGVAYASFASAHEFSGYISAEGRLFFYASRYPEQEQNNASATMRPEYYHEWENGSSLTFVPFGRLDSVDSQRNHFDIRELNYLWLADTWELRLGFGKVFWGTTEFVHLVDIINQTDLVEDISLEKKLGQPMVQISIARDWGIVDMFVMSYFRERTYPGREGRLRSALVVDIDKTQYESANKEWQIDAALRYSHSIGDWDIGLSHFYGTGREPTLLPDFGNEDETVLIPFYSLINQTGLDLQLILGEWLFKLETIYRSGQGDDFCAATGGFEYSFFGIGGSDVDVGLIGEYVYDDRGDDAPTPYQNDAMGGLRLAFNDPAGSELLAWIVYDTNSSAAMPGIEASRRFSENWKVKIEAWGFIDIPEDDPIYSLRDDDYLRLELAYYF